MKLNEKQLAQVDRQIKRLIAGDSYYGKILKEKKITGVSSQEEFEALPFSSKDDLRNAYPLGIQAVPDEEIVRIHSSSGTTGKPVIIPYTAKDVDDWAAMFARCYEVAGITKNDRIQITAGYGLWTAGIGFQAGCEKLGAMAIPMGPGNTEKQIQMMQDLKSTVLTATSSYALLLAEEINKRGLKDKIYLKKGVFGSERWSKKMRKYIKDELGVELLGTKLSAIDQAEDRDLFKQLMEDLGQPIPESEIVSTVEEAVLFANSIGYPVIVRPAFTLGGTGGGMCANEEELREIDACSLEL